MACPGMCVFQQRRAYQRVAELGRELQGDELAKPGRVVVPQRLGVAELLAAQQPCVAAVKNTFWLLLLWLL